jgi:methylmalonyl-CoA/ethylmalonyl-CoA epimerase
MTLHAPAGFENPAMGLPGFLFVDHIAIAVPAGTLDAHVAAYGLLGFREIHRETLSGSDGVREALLQIGNSPNLIQLLEPLRPDSPVQKAIDRNGGKGGLNHVGFRVKDIQAAFDHMKRNGFQILDPAPRPGSRGTTVFFVHPKGLAATPLNVLIEVVQE